MLKTILGIAVFVAMMIGVQIIVTMQFGSGLTLKSMIIMAAIIGCCLAIHDTVDRKS